MINCVYSWLLSNDKVYWAEFHIDQSIFRIVLNWFILSFKIVQNIIIFSSNQISSQKSCEQSTEKIFTPPYSWENVKFVVGLVEKNFLFVTEIFNLKKVTTFGAKEPSLFGASVPPSFIGASCQKCKHCCSVQWYGPLLRAVSTPEKQTSINPYCDTVCDEKGFIGDSRDVGIHTLVVQT